MSIGMSTTPKHADEKLFSMRRHSPAGVERRTQLTVVEEPLEIRILHWFKNVPKADSLAVLMRTPGADRQLVAGYLFGESILKRRNQLLDLHPLGDEAASNEYLAELSPDVDVESMVSHTRFVNSSCRLCGKRGLDALPEPAMPPSGALVFDAATILRVSALLAARRAPSSDVRERNTAALITAEGAVEAAFHDVVPANALHKLLGHCFLKDVDLGSRAIGLDSDCGFEHVLKAISAGIPMLIARGAPSSLAIEAARARQLTLIGFLSDDGFNVYSGESRIR
jgi:FdhD protein